MNQKTIIAILGVVVVVVVVILLCTTVYFATINKTSQLVAPAPKVVQQPTSTPATQPVAQQSTTPAQDVEQKNIVLYSNSDFGFKIQLPVDFQDYKVKTFAINADTTRISFFLPTSDKSFKESNAFPGYSEFFIIDAMTTDSWNKLHADCESGKKQDMGCITEVIGKNKQFAFQPGLNGTPAKDVAKRVENKITFEYLRKNFSVLP